MDEIEKWNLVLNNTKNLITALQESKLSIEILVNSEAVGYLVASNNTENNLKILRDLSTSVTFAACHNSLRAMGIDPSSLLDFVSGVPSGVAELVIKQNEGYAYIKP